MLRIDREILLAISTVVMAALLLVAAFIVWRQRRRIRISQRDALNPSIWKGHALDTAHLNPLIASLRHRHLEFLRSSSQVPNSQLRRVAAARNRLRLLRYFRSTPLVSKDTVHGDDVNLAG